MPEVGVLNLTIHDNSETAAQGLNHLTDALVDVQQALGNGLKIAGVAGPLNRFANTVGANSKTFANVGTFLNAMKEYQKAFKDAENVKFNAQPIQDLKDAIGDGIKIGQAGTQINKIKEALGGGWDTTQSANIKTVLQDIAEGAKSFQGTNIGATAKGLENISKALGLFAKNGASVKEMMQSRASAVSESMKELQDSARAQQEWFDAGGFATGKRMPLNLQLFGGKGDDGFSELKNQIHDVTQGAQEFNIRLQEVGDTLTSIKANPFEEMYQSFSKLAHELGWFQKESLRLMGGSSPLLLGDGRTPGQLLLGDGQDQQTFLSTWVDTAEQWKQNWVDFSSEAANEMRSQWKPDWIIGEGVVSDAQEIAEKSAEAFSNTSAVDNYNSTMRETKAAVGATLKEFELLEQNGAFRSYMYGPRNDIGANGIGFQPGFETDAERIAKNPQWYNNEDFYEKAREAATVAREENDKLTQSIEQTQQVMSNPDMAYVDGLIKNAQGADLLNMKIESLTEKLYEGVSSGKMTGDQIANTVAQIQQLKGEVDSLTDSTFSLSGAWAGLRAGMRKMFPTLTQMLGRFKQIAKYRMLRSVIRHITAGFSEGLQNVYGYSKAIGGSFAPAMDSAATAIAQMKNSLGAALAPAIQAVIPYVNQLVSWFITLVNYVNQFFALLNGQASWTRALPATTNAFDKQTKAAKGAGAAMKDLLADWDELNIIQSQTGGGGAGSGKTAEDYLKMFEEVARFDNNIRKITDFVKNNIGDLTNMIKDAGIALLAWKFSNAFTGPLALVAGLAAAGKTLEITWKLTEMFDNEYMKSGEAGWLVADVLTNLVGSYFAGTIFQTILGGGAGLISFGFGMDVSAGITYGIALTEESADRADMLKTIAAIKGTIGFAAMAAGFGVATGSAGLGIGLAAMFGIPMFTLSAAVSTVIYQLKTAKQIAKEAFTKKHEGAITVSELYKELNDEFKKQSQGYSIVIDAMANVPDLKVSLGDATTAILGLSAVVTGGDALTQDEAEKFKEAWTTVFSAFEGITTDSFDTIFDALNLSLASENEEIRKQAKELRISLIMLEENTTQGIAEVKAEMDELADKIALGKATDEEMAQYQTYIVALAKLTDQSFTELEETVKKGTNIDFNSMDEVNEFFNNVNEEAKRTADEIDEGVNSAIAGIDEVRSLTEFRKAVGLIGQEEYDAVMAMLDETQANITKEAEGRKSKVDTAVRDAYQLILQSAIEGLNEIPLTSNGDRDYIAGAEYLINHIMPIVDEVKKRGGEIEEGLASALGSGVSLDEVWRQAVEAFKTGDFRNLPIFQYLIDLWDDQETKNRVAKESNDWFDNAIKDVKKFEEDYGNALKEVGDNISKALTFQAPTADEPRIELPKSNNDNPMGWMDIFGLSYTPPTEDNIAVPITIEPDFEIDISNETIEEVRKSIQEALNNDERMDEFELEMLYTKYNPQLVQDAWDQLLNEGMNPDGTFGKIPAGMRIATTGINYGPNNVPVNYAPAGQNNTIVTEPKDPQQEINNTASGVERGNKNLEGLMRDLLAAMNRVGDRPITVSLFPSSGWGSTNRQSESRYEAVTGVNG